MIDHSDVTWQRYSGHGDDIFSIARCPWCRDKLKHLIADLVDEAHEHDHD